MLDAGPDIHNFSRLILLSPLVLTRRTFSLRALADPPQGFAYTPVLNKLKFFPSAMFNKAITRVSQLKAAGNPQLMDTTRPTR